MDLMQLRAMAKINLGLDVVRKREDGYHEVRQSYCLSYSGAGDPYIQQLAFSSCE